MIYEDKDMGNSIEKSALASPTIWSDVATIAGGLIVAVPEIAQEVAPILSPHTAGIVVAVAGIIGILRRVFSANKTITSFLPK